MFKKRLGPARFGNVHVEVPLHADNASNPSHGQLDVSRNEETWVIVPKVKFNLQRTGHQTQEHHHPMGCMHVVMRHKRDPNMI